MSASPSAAFAKSAVIVRWAARALSALILLFWCYFIVAHVVGDQGAATRPLHASDYLGLFAMAAWLGGLALAWKWELAGGVIALVALLISACMNVRLLVFPGPLIGTAAMLFALSWWLNRTNREANHDFRA